MCVRMAIKAYRESLLAKILHSVSGSNEFSNLANISKLTVITHTTYIPVLTGLIRVQVGLKFQDYSTEGMNETQQVFLQHLREFGLVYQRKRKEKRYYPTRLAINLTSGVSGLSTQAQSKGYLMVETNYRIYAYTGKT